MSPRSTRGVMVAIALVLVVAAIALFVAASMTSGAGSWLTLCSLGGGLIAAAGAFTAGALVIGALAPNEPVTTVVTGSRVDAEV